MDKSEFNKKRIEELKKIIQPIENFMKQYCSPHDMLVIQQNSVELLSGEVAFPINKDVI